MPRLAIEVFVGSATEENHIYMPLYKPNATFAVKAIWYRICVIARVTSTLFVSMRGSTMISPGVDGRAIPHQCCRAVLRNHHNL